MTVFFYDLLYCFSVSILSVSLLWDHTGAKEHAIAGVIIAVILPVFFTAVKNAGRRFKLLILGIPSVIAVSVLSLTGLKEGIEYLSSNLWILWLVFICIGAYLLAVLIRSYILVRRIAAMVIIAGAILLTYYNEPIKKVSVAVAMLLLLIFLVEMIQRKWNKVGDTDMKRHVACISPFLLVFALLVLASPARKEAYDWKFAVELYYKAVAGFDRINFSLFKKADDSFANAGFTENGTFVSSFKNNNMQIFTVNPSIYSGRVVYLGGTSMDHFDGRGWSEKNVPDRKMIMLDTLETRCAVWQADSEYMTDHIRESSVRIAYTGYYTHYFFAPVKTLMNTGKLGEFSYHTEGTGILSDKKLGPGDAYTIYYFRLNKDSEHFRDLVKSAEAIDRDTWETVRYNYFKSGSSGLEYEDYLAYRDEVYKTYLSDVKLSPELSEKLDEVIKGADSDIEKMQRTEAWLKRFKYSSSPGKIPNSVDTPEEFLDHFLLNTQSGYCAYYATAMAMLARSQGLPARYVQGYRVSFKDAGTVAVTKNMAHAWCEIYFDNVGWIPFEATPGYSMGKPWEAANRNETETNVEYGQQRTAEVTVEEKEPVEEKNDIDPKLVLYPLIGLAVFIILYILMSRLIYSIRTARMDNESRAMLLCRRNLRFLRLMGYKKDDAETLEEYGMGLPAETDKGFITCMEKILYSEQKINDDMLATVERSAKEILKQLKKKNIIYRLFVW